MPRQLITMYAMLPRGGSGTLPPPPPPPPPPSSSPQEPAPPQADKKEDSDDKEFNAGQPTDEEAEEAAAEQRAILASFETRHRDESAWQFMLAERRAVAAARLADTQAVARAEAHRRNLEAMRAEVEQRLAEADRTGGLASVVVARQGREN
jgi:hypothetical protein